MQQINPSSLERKGKLPTYLVEFSTATVEQMVFSSKEAIEHQKTIYNPKDIKFNESMKRKLMLSALSLTGFSFYVQHQKTKSMLQQVVTQISFKIDEAKEEIILGLTKEFRRQRTIELIGDTSGLIRNLGHFYDSPSKNKLELLLNDTGKHLGSLVTQLNEVDEPKLIFHIFSLYTLTICIYCLMHFESIVRYSEKDEETDSISKRVLEEINLIDLRYNNLKNKLYKSVEIQFSEVQEVIHEPKKNWINPWAAMYYIFRYQFNGKMHEVKRIKIEQTPKIKYDPNPTPHLIIKKRGDGDYYLWPEKDTRNAAYNFSESARKSHLNKTFNELYGEYINSESEFIMQVDAYRNVFSELRQDKWERIMN